MMLYLVKVLTQIHLIHMSYMDLAFFRHGDMLVYPVWDDYHPSARAHKFIAEDARQTLAQAYKTY